MKALRNKIPMEQFVEMYGFGNKKSDSSSKDSRDSRSDRSNKDSRGDRKRRDDSRDSSRSSRDSSRSSRSAPDKSTKPEEEEKKKEPVKLSPELEEYKKKLGTIRKSQKAVLYDSKKKVIKEVPVKDMIKTLDADGDSTKALVFDGIITQKLLDVAADKGLETVVGARIGNVTKKPTSVATWTAEDLE